MVPSNNFYHNPLLKSYQEIVKQKEQLQKEIENIRSKRAKEYESNLRLDYQLVKTEREVEKVELQFTLTNEECIKKTRQHSKLRAKLAKIKQEECKRAIKVR